MLRWKQNLARRTADQVLSRTGHLRGRVETKPKRRALKQARLTVLYVAKTMKRRPGSSVIAAKNGLMGSVQT